MEEKKDFKEVKVKVSGALKEHTETLDRSMLYSGVNIFGTLTNLYLSSKEQFQSAGISAAPIQKPSEALSGASGNSMMSLGNEVLSIFKKMQKRDSITKIKACHELKKYVDSIEPDSEELPNLLTFFLYHLCRILLNEPDKLVREAAHDSFTSFIRKAKRRLGPHIKKVFPLWYCAFFDPSPEVGRIARANFELAFPIENQPKIFLLSFKMFLNFCNQQLQQSGEDTSQDKKANEEIFDRVTCSVLQALASAFTFIQKWSVDEQTVYHKKLVEIFELGQPTKGKQQNILWSYLGAKGSIKAACLQFIAAFINNMPSEIVKDHVKTLTPAVMSLVAEQNPSLQTTFWREALFTLCAKFPDCWDYVQIKKDFLPKLYKCLKESAFGAPTPLYENFVRYLSVCPLYRLDIDDKVNKASFKDRCGLIREVLVMLYQGIQQEEAVAYHQELIGCYFECVTFILLKRIQPVSGQEESQFAIKQMEKVLQQPIKDFVATYQKSSSKHQKARTLRSSFQSKFVKMIEDLASRNIAPTLFTQICDMIQVEMLPQSRNAMRLISSLHQAPLSAQYRTLLNQSILSKVFYHQSQVVSQMVSDLSSKNIEECNQYCRAHSRLVYTSLKKEIQLDYSPIPVGDLLNQVIKKELLAKNVLNNQQLMWFKDLQQVLVEIAVLYLANGFQIQTQFAKILLALGLLDEQVSQQNQLEEVVFRPDFPKAPLNCYYSILRESDEIHDLMVGALSLRMLAPSQVTEYHHLVNRVVADSVNKQTDGILNEDDLELVRTQIVSQLYNNLPAAQKSAYFKSVEALCTDQSELNDELRELLFESLLQTKCNHFDDIWAVFKSSAAVNQRYQEQVQDKLQLIVTQTISKQASIQEFTHLTRVIKMTVQLTANKVGALGAILLQERNFMRLEDNCLPLKMFQDLFLQGGVGFNIQELFQIKSQRYEFAWLAAVFLSVKHLVSLSGLMELRRQLMIFVETEVMPAIVSLAHTEFIIDVFAYLKQKRQLHTFESLARMIADPHDPVLKIDEIKEVFRLVEPNSQLSLNEENDFLVVALQTLGYFILDEPVVVQLYHQVRDALSKTITKLSLDIYMALDKWFGQESQEFQLVLLSKLLKHSSIEMQQNSITLVNLLLDRYGKSIQQQIDCAELFNVVVVSLDDQQSCQNMVTLAKVIRKTMEWFPDSIAASLLHAARDRAQHFDDALKLKLKIKPFEVEMLQELAETILVCPLTINEHNLTPSIEENLYFLLGCSFEPLQKAAYVLLKFIYENFILPVEFQASEEDDLKNLVAKIEETKVTSTAFKNISPSLLRLIDEAPSNEDNQDFVTELDALVYGLNEEGQMNNKVFGYLLAWNAMLHKIEHGRIKSQLQGDNSQYLQVLSALTEFLETDNTTYHMLLLSLVPYLPKIPKKGADTFDINAFQPEYCNLREPKQAQKMCLMSLINFMKSFPSLGRKFYQECDRQLLEVMLPYIKTVISPAILDNEIKKIELSQLELGASSDLTFVLFKSTKEVIATYNKSAELSCQLKIKIPHDYPLKSVVVDIGEQLKLKQTQIRKWTLSIRNLLQSRNGDIISAILLWKSNIDKEMQGIEECTICYSVMHQTDKSLPSMQCRNCKNKFHVACIRKWFNTSNKSNCPLCQTFFFQ